MAKRKNPGRNELMNDYKMLDSMSKSLAEHQKRLLGIGKSIMKKSTNSDLTTDVVANLDTVFGHMRKAQRELNKARDKLKMI